MNRGRDESRRKHKLLQKIILSGVDKYKENIAAHRF